MVEREREREREKSGVPVSAHVPCTWFCPHLQGELMVAGGRWLDIKKKKKKKKGTHVWEKMGLGGGPLQIDFDPRFNL